ncbi:MAG: ParB/RepB/Spo0J family partition protein [Candidatus Nitrosocosmicus sp.]
MSNWLIQGETLKGNFESLHLEDISLPVHKLRDNYSNSVIEEIAKSIQTHGLLHPITVREKNNYFEIVAGCRRFLACQYLDWKKIPCCIVNLNDAQTFEFSLVENLERKSLSPLEEAKAFKKYIENEEWGGLTRLASKIGKSPSYITRRISLLTLPNNIQDKIKDTSISPSIAQELIPLDNPTKQSQIANTILKSNLPLKEVRKIVKDNLQGRSIPTEASVRDSIQKIDKATSILTNMMDKLVYLTIENDRDSMDENAMVRQHSLVIRETLLNICKQVDIQANNLAKLKDKIT